MPSISRTQGLSVDELKLRPRILFGSMLHRVFRSFLLRRVERVQGMDLSLDDPGYTAASCTSCLASAVCTVGAQSVPVCLR